MNFEKIKEILKNKKMKVMAGTLAGVLIVAVAGSIIVHNKNIENKSVAVEKSEKKDTKQSSDKEKKDAKKELEELKKVDTSKLSDEDKKELEKKIADTEKKVEDNNNDGSSKEVAESTSNSSANKATNNSSSSSNSSTSSSSKSSGSAVSESKPSVVKEESHDHDHEHTHNWVPITETVHHAEEGHWEDVVVKAAWTESVPVFEERAVTICNGCGEDITNNRRDHIMQQMLAGKTECSGWHEDYRQVQVGTNTIQHPATTTRQWVIDKEAWTETVTTGYKCSICGETK